MQSWSLQCFFIVHSTLEVKTIRSFETSGSTEPQVKHQIPEPGILTRTVFIHYYWALRKRNGVWFGMYLSESSGVSVVLFIVVIGGERKVLSALPRHPTAVRCTYTLLNTSTQMWVTNGPMHNNPFSSITPLRKVVFARHLIPCTLTAATAVHTQLRV